MEKENCTICLYPITNPICIDCYLREVYAWLLDNEVNKIHRDFIIDKIRNILSFETLNEGKCIICGRVGLNICTYCFFSMTERLLKEINFSKKLIENFNETFNFKRDEESQIVRTNLVVSYEKAN